MTLFIYTTYTVLITFFNADFDAEDEILRKHFFADLIFFQTQNTFPTKVNNCYILISQVFWKVVQLHFLFNEFISICYRFAFEYFICASGGKWSNLVEIKNKIQKIFRSKKFLNPQNIFRISLTLQRFILERSLIVLGSLKKT